MSNKVSGKLYTAKDIEKYLRINSNTLYHWVQTRRLLKPAIEGVGRGKSNFFNLENIATIYLIKILNNSGVELEAIKNIFLEKAFPDIWKIYKSGRKKYKKNGLGFLINVEKKEGKVAQIYLCSWEALFQYLGQALLKFSNVRSTIIVNVIGIIEDLEKMTGEEF